MINHAQDNMVILSNENIIYLNEVLNDCENYLTKSSNSKILDHPNESLLYLYDKLKIAVQSCINCNFNQDKYPTVILKLEIFSFILSKYYKRESVFSLKNVNSNILILLATYLNLNNVNQVNNYYYPNCL